MVKSCFVGEIVTIKYLEQNNIPFKYHDEENSDFDFIINDKKYDSKTTTFNKKEIKLRYKQLEANIYCVMINKKEIGKNIIQIMDEIKNKDIINDKIIFYKKIYENGFKNIIDSWKIDNKDILFEIDNKLLPKITTEVSIKEITLSIDENNFENKLSPI